MNPFVEQKPGSPLWWRWLVWLAYALSWTEALLMPDPSRVLVGFTRWVRHLLLGTSLHDLVRLADEKEQFFLAKALHICAYATFAMLSGWLAAPRRLRWLLVLFMAAHAAGTEYAQVFVPTRHGSLRDVALDLVGVALGMALTLKLWQEPDAVAVALPARACEEPSESAPLATADHG